MVLKTFLFLATLSATAVAIYFLPIVNRLDEDLCTGLKIVTMLLFFGCVRTFSNLINL